MTTTIQRSLAGGEIAPSIYARPDTVKYSTGAKIMRNWMVMRQGGAEVRPGTVFIANTKHYTDASKTVRLFPFKFNDDQTYLLEFGDQYIRFYQNDTQIQVSGVTAWSNVTAYVVGDLASRLGINYYCILAHTNQQPPNATYWYPLTGTIFELPTPYADEDLAKIKFVQSADVITLVHPDYKPRELRRLGATNWTLSELNFYPSINPPVGTSLSGTVSGSNRFRYKVTVIDKDTGEESLPGGAQVATITNITNASPARITTSAGFAMTVGDDLFITGVLGMLEVNNKAHVSSNQNNPTLPTQLDLDGIDSTNWGTYVSGGVVRLMSVAANNVAVPTAANPIVINPGTLPARVKTVVIYKDTGAGFGFIGTCNPGQTFRDTNIPPDLTRTPPTFVDVFSTPATYPACVSYFKQRLALARGINLFMSRIGKFKNFTTSFPVIQDDDSIKVPIVGHDVSEIRNLIETKKPIVLTAGEEVTIDGGPGGVITPIDIFPTQQEFRGSSDIRPVIIDDTVIFNQARTSKLIDLKYSFQSDGYAGNDLTTFSSHLFDGYTILAMAYQQTPHPRLWVVRSDFVILCLTYIKEQEILGWSRCDTPIGGFEDACSIPVGSEDVVYLAARRTVSGQKLYIERMAKRDQTDVADFKFLDSCLTYDGRNTDSGERLVLLSGPGQWTTEFEMQLQVATGTTTFSLSEVGNVYVLRLDGEIIRCTVVEYTDPSNVRVRVDHDVPLALQAASTFDWDRAVDTVTGLTHLEGQSVAVLADGAAVNNLVDNNMLTVTGGSVTISQPAAVIHVGLQYLMDIQTLPIENTNGESIVGKGKLTYKVNLLVESTRGIFVGPQAKTDDELVDGLMEVKHRTLEDEYNLPSLVTGVMEVNITGEWDKDGSTFIRQGYPLPAKILGLASEGIYVNQGGQ